MINTLITKNELKSSRKGYEQALLKLGAEN